MTEKKLIHVNLKNSVPIYQKDGDGAVFPVATLRQGDDIFVGDADTIFRLKLGEEEHEFIQIPYHSQEGDLSVKDGDYFIRTIELPSDF